MNRLPALTLGACLLAANASGQARGAAPKPTERHSLRSRFGVDAVRSPLRSETSADREHAFERLGTLGTPRALELLARALDTDGAARDAHERLAVVRALAPHAGDPTAADALIRALGGVEGHVDERALLVESTAALALAASHDPRALAALARALRQPGRVSEHALLALRADPPSDASVLLQADGMTTVALTRLLGELGDARALDLVEKLTLDGDPAVRAAAAGAFFLLAPERAVTFAERAFTSEADPNVRGELARVLAVRGSPFAARAFADVLADARSRPSALALALDVENAGFGAALARTPPGDEPDRLFAALGHQGGKEALARLESALAKPTDAWSALYALASSPDAGADDVLARALARPALRRDAARAATLRSLLHERSVSGAEKVLTALGRGDDADRAAAARCRAVLDPEHAAALLGSPRPAEVRAAARTAGTELLALTAARRLAREPDPSIRAALAISLAVPAAADAVPTSVLLDLVETRGAATYLAAYALAARDSEALRPELRELFASDDPVLRAHVALGLGRSEQPSAVGMLADAYRGEADAGVRRAIVRALAVLREPARLRTLAFAAELEPDDDARTLARAALGGTPQPGAGPRHAAWLRLRGASEPSFATITSADGLARPFAADPDGAVTVFGLPAGDVELTLGVAAPGHVPKVKGKP